MSFHSSLFYCILSSELYCFFCKRKNRYNSSVPNRDKGKVNINRTTNSQKRVILEKRLVNYYINIVVLAKEKINSLKNEE